MVSFVRRTAMNQFTRTISVSEPEKAMLRSRIVPKLHAILIGEVQQFTNYTWTFDCTERTLHMLKKQNNPPINLTSL